MRSLIASFISRRELLAPQHIDEQPDIIILKIPRRQACPEIRIMHPCEDRGDCLEIIGLPRRR